MALKNGFSIENQIIRHWNMVLIKFTTKFAYISQIIKQRNEKNCIHIMNETTRWDEKWIQLEDARNVSRNHSSFIFGVCQMCHRKIKTLSTLKCLSLSFSVSTQINFIHHCYKCQQQQKILLVTHINMYKIHFFFFKKCEEEDDKKK